MNCPHCNFPIKDAPVLKESEDIRMKQAIDEGEKAMSQAIYAFGKAASEMAKNEINTSLGSIHITSSFGNAETTAAPEDYLRSYFKDIEEKVEESKSVDLLTYLAQNLMRSKLVVSPYLGDRFEKEKSALLDTIFYRLGVLR